MLAVKNGVQPKLEDYKVRGNSSLLLVRKHTIDSFKFSIQSMKLADALSCLTFANQKCYQYSEPI